MIWELKKSIIKFVLTPLFTKFHVLLSLPTPHHKTPGFPLRLDKPELIFMDLLETLSQVKINPVLVLSLTLCHEMKPSVYSFQKGLRSSFISDNLKPVCDTAIPEVTGK